MLETTHALLGATGPNPKWAAEDGAWSLLLPEEATVTMRGPVDWSLVDVLASRVRRVVLAPGMLGLRTALARRRARRLPHGNVTVLARRSTPPAADVAVLRPRIGERPVPPMLPEGLLVVLGRRRAVLPPGLEGIPALGAELRDGRIVALDPLTAPRHRLSRDRTPWRARWSRLRHRRRATRRRAAVVVAEFGDVTRPPEHLCAALTAEGHAAEAYRWSVRDHGAYRTNKLLVRLTPDDPRRPALLVKAVRDPRDAVRLARERHALDVLAGTRLGAGRAPRVVAAGSRDGRAFLVETDVGGVPFREAAPHRIEGGLREAVSWLVDVGIATAHPLPGRRDLSGLEELVHRFCALHRPDPALRRELDRHVDVVRSESHQLPLVLQHGDPGTWNLRVGERGGVQVLDWESAEEHGLPLWDVFYLVRSHAVWQGRRRRRRDPVAIYDDLVLRPGPLHDLQQEAATRFCDATGMPPRLVVPLLHLCWLHRAVKEATRREPWTPGGYARLLAHCLHREHLDVAPTASAGTEEVDECAS